MAWTWAATKDWYDAEEAKAAAASNGNGSHPAAGGDGNDQPPPPPESPAPPQDDDDTPPGEHTEYVIAGVRSQLAQLRAKLPGTHRNIALFISAKALGRIEGVDRRWLTRRLIAASEANGYTAQDGIKAVQTAIRSGFKAADKEGPRIIPDDPSYFVHEVSLADLGYEEVSDEEIDTNTAAAVATRSTIFALEEDFWSRPSLARIKEAALMKMSPPWSVLCNCAARVLYLVPPQVQLPGIRGGPTSLNWYGALSTPSGGGKGVSRSVARQLVLGVPSSDNPGIGSGEGIIAEFRPPGKNPVNKNALVFKVEEVDTLSAMTERSGSTTQSVLRDCWMGDCPNLSYVKNANTTPLGEQEYRMTLTLGVQPGRAAAIVTEKYGGTLQRFQWFPAFDLRVTKAASRPYELIDALDIPEPGRWAGIGVLTVPDEVVEAVQDNAELEGQGLVDPLDTHMVLVRIKFAFALAVLDDRTEMDSEDWRLAGIAIAVSKATRTWVINECQKVEDEIATERGRPMGLVQHAATEAKLEAAGKTERTIARAIEKKLREKGPMTLGALSRDLAKGHRHRVEGILRRLAAEDSSPVVKITTKNANGRIKEEWDVP